MAGRTRRQTAEASGSGGAPAAPGAPAAQDAPNAPQGPPPAAPNLAEVMHNQTRLLEELVRNNAAQRGPAPAPAHALTVMDFQRCDPPSFTTATEPLIADDWIRALGIQVRAPPLPQ